MPFILKADMSTEQVLKNQEFELRGVNHLALVCSDMKRTMDFYRDVLGMPLVDDMELPDGMGHHFFFDIGKGALLAFFWFRSAPGMASSRENLRDSTNPSDFIAADSSIYHLAFNVPAEKIDEYFQRLTAKGVPATIVNYFQSPHQYSETVTENTTGQTAPCWSSPRSYSPSPARFVSGRQQKTLERIATSPRRSLNTRTK
jgi:catechol 2,3-dioxygenase-like lactoylglutathione lyase family enzyme